MRRPPWRQVVLLLALLFMRGVGAATVTVTTTADSGAGSLRAAVAGAGAGDTVAFAPGVTGTLTLTSGSITIDKALVLAGPGAPLLAVVNVGGRVFDVAASGAAVAISGLHLSGSGSPPGANGGAIAHTGGHLSLDAVLIDHSSVTAAWNGGGLGGAVYSPFNAAEGGSSLAIRNSTLDSNQAGKGGAIYLQGQSLSIDNSTITRNAAADSGGAISIEAGAWATIQQATIHGNSANLGAGVYVRTGASATLNNTLAAQNSDSGGLNDVDHGNNTVGATGSLFSEGDAANVLYNGANSANLFGVTDPRLTALAGNGGATPTLLPLADSPAVDAADCLAGITQDQRGVARPQGARCDIGAVELASTPVNPPTVAAVPTLQAWALIGLALMLAGLAPRRRAFRSRPEGL